MAELTVDDDHLTVYYDDADILVSAEQKVSSTTTVLRRRPAVSLCKSCPLVAAAGGVSRCRLH